MNVRELVHCGLFQAMLDEHGDKVSGARDRVSLHSDGTWTLMAENRLRFSTSKRKSSDVGGGSQASTANPDASEEVIELD